MLPIYWHFALFDIWPLPAFLFEPVTDSTSPLSYLSLYSEPASPSRQSLISHFYLSSLFHVSAPQISYKRRRHESWGRHHIIRGHIVPKSKLAVQTPQGRKTWPHHPSRRPHPQRMATHSTAHLQPVFKYLSIRWLTKEGLIYFSVFSAGSY